MARIVVCGYMIRHPVAGNLLAYFHYVLGFHRLGHEVLYLEESGWPQSCYDPVAREFIDNPEAGLRAVQGLMTECGVNIPVAYVNRDSGATAGASWLELKSMLRSADLLLNVGGVCWLPELELCRRRALIDMDPLFTQVGRFARESLDKHHIHFTYGANLGRPGCTVPTCGIDWHPVFPPVIPQLWDQSPRRRPSKDGPAPLTTIANWSAYGSVTYRGNHYGQKDEEFLRLLELPRRCSQKLELALSGASLMEARLQAAGWSVRDSQEVSTDVATYRDYITSSRGEFSVAKHAYVKTRSGWFSDRSVCYLAAGLPVVLQDTGYTRWLPASHGVIPFSSIDEAAEGIERVNRNYPTCRQSARDLAENTFSYRRVLPRLLETALGAKTFNFSGVGGEQ